MEETIVKEPTWKEWIILKNLALCINISPTYKKEWAERSNAKSFDPTFAKVFSMLEHNNILKSMPWVGRAKKIDIDIKRLDNFIIQTKIYNEFKQYVHKKELFVVGV